jgi:hypothetical protein
LKRVFENLQGTFGERLTLYLDFHSHASQRRAFVFGNFLPTSAQMWNMTYAKLLETHAQGLFDFGSSKFSRADMSSKDGTSRVLFGANVINSFTVEVAHFSVDGRVSAAYSALTPLKPPGTASTASEKASPYIGDGRGEILDECVTVGRASVLALLDLCLLQQSPEVSAVGGLDGIVRSARAAALAAASTKKR